MQPLSIWGGCLALFIASVSAQEAVTTCRIPPQPLAGALDAFSRQADVEMFYPDEVLQGQAKQGSRARTPPTRSTAASTGRMPSTTTGT